MNRREVLIRVGTLLIAIPASRVLMACGGNGLTFTTSTDDGHHHTVSLQQSDINTPPAAGVTETTSLDNSHTHTVSLTEADLMSIQAGNTVTKTTSEDETPLHVHTHTVAFHK